MKIFSLIFAVACVAYSITSSAQDSAQVIVDKQGVTLDTAEVDAFLLTLPPGDREVFAASKQRLIEAIDSLIVNKVAYHDALSHDIGELPEVKAKIKQAQRRIVIEAWLEEYAGNQPDADYGAIAQEKYIIDKDEYVSPETVDVKHILITPGTSGPQAAHARAQEVLERIKSSDIDFDEAARKYTQDPTYRQNGGLIQGIRRGATSPDFEHAAFALTEAMPLSEVVDTRFGSHIIYLVAKHPQRPLTFEEVKEQLIEQAREEYKQQVITNYLEQIRKQEVTVDNEVLNTYLGSHQVLLPSTTGN